MRGQCSTGPFFHEALEVFADDVEFEVNGVICFFKWEVGMFPGMGDELACEGRVREISNGEADAF